MVNKEVLKCIIGKFIPIHYLDNQIYFKEQFVLAWNSLCPLNDVAHGPLLFEILAYLTAAPVFVVSEFCRLIKYSITRFIFSQHHVFLYQDYIHNTYDETH